MNEFSIDHVQFLYNSDFVRCYCLQILKEIISSDLNVEKIEIIYAQQVSIKNNINHVIEETKKLICRKNEVTQQIKNDEINLNNQLHNYKIQLKNAKKDVYVSITYQLRLLFLTVFEILK